MAEGGRGKGKKKRCVLCGCADHRLVGCHRHAARRCSCFGGAQ